MSFTSWLREHAVPLTTLDPGAPLDDLVPLLGVIGDARVVAIGEGAHFCEEYNLVRERLLRFLVERAGFTVFGFEYGFSEGFEVDAWVRGEGGEELAAPAELAVGIEVPLRRLREHNRTAPAPVGFAGLDIPAAGGSLRPSLDPVAEYVREVDPELLPQLEAALELADRFASSSGAAAVPAWNGMDPVAQDALTAALSRLRTRFLAAELMYTAVTGQEAFDRALHRVEGAVAADYSLRAMSALFAGENLDADTTAREVYLASSVRWHLEHAAPGARMVLAAHNAHIQKAPAVFDGKLTGFPMGNLLHRALGDDYVAIAATCGGGTVAEMALDEHARHGFTVADTPLPPREEGSVEAAFEGAGLGLSLAGLRGAPAAGAPDRIRMQSYFQPMPVIEAFDAVLHVPESTVVKDLDL